MELGVRRDSAPETRSVRTFADWRVVMGDRFVPLVLTQHGAGPFRGTVISTHVGEGWISDVVAGPHQVRRRPEDIRNDQQAHLKLTMQFEGIVRLSQDGRSTLLTPGDFAIYDTGHPYELDFTGNTHSFVMMFPHRRIGLPDSLIRELTAIAFRGDGGIGPLVRAVFEHLAAHPEHLNGSSGQRVLQSALDLITATLTAEFERGSRPLASRRGELALINSYVDAHIADPTLSASVVAAGCYMSLRSLQQVFHDAGTTVTRFIRTRRIERCSADLADPLLFSVPIFDIAVRWGFSDAAHFSRVFRQQVGCTPSEFRTRTRVEA